MKDLLEEHKTPHRDGDNTLTRDDDVHSTPKRDKLSTHRPQNKRPMSLTLNGGDNRHLVTSKSNERTGQEISENIDVKPRRLNSQTELRR